jgi:abortive infection bacteriophage resistance protein
VNEIKNCIDDCKAKLFADTSNLFVYGKTLREVFLKANDAVARLSKWFTAHKLSSSIDKTLQANHLTLMITL